MEEKPCVHSIMTMMFTKDGDVIVIKNEKNELDTLPQYFFGKKEKESFQTNLFALYKHLHKHLF